MKNANKAATENQAKAAKPMANKSGSSRGKQAAANTYPKADKTWSDETIGIDVGDRVSQFCRLDASGEIIEQGRFHTNATSVEKHFAKLPSAVIALETGTHSGWIARMLKMCGHHVVVANPRELASITRSKKKSDRNDAEQLARLARADLKLLKPTYVRSLEAARDAIPLRTREGFVRARTLLVNVARSLAKIEEERLSATITKHFGERALATLRDQREVTALPTFQIREQVLLFLQGSRECPSRTTGSVPAGHCIRGNTTLPYLRRLPVLLGKHGRAAAVPAVRQPPNILLIDWLSTERTERHGA